MDVLGGIEGGATRTKLLLIRTDGTVLTTVEAPGSNPYLIGLNEAVKQFADMVQTAKTQSNLPLDKPIKGLGMAISGAEDEALNQKMVQQFRKIYPHVAEAFYITTDSIGTILASMPNGGIVLIAGTGSSARLLNPDGSIHGCGAWGHLIGDQASAYWVAMTAVKTVFDHEDGLVLCPFDISYVKEKMLQFYGIKQRVELLDQIYLNFNKANFSKFCEVLAKGASVDKDPLCRQLFRENGIWLGRHILGVAKHAHKSLLEDKQGLSVVTVGSIWKSFDLMKQGFLQGLQPRTQEDATIARIRLLRLTASPAIGAANLAATKANVKLDLDFSKNYELLFENDV